MKRLEEILLHSDTEYAEFLLGILSIVTGMWLCVPAYSVPAIARPFITFVPLWGILLMCAGALKYVGVLRGRLGMRRLSCALAMLLWWFMATGYIMLYPVVTHTPKHPLISTMLGLGLFNAMIYIKLSSVRRAQ